MAVDCPSAAAQPATEATGDAAQQREAVTGPPAAQRANPADDRSSAASAAKGSLHEVQAAAVAEHSLEVLQLPASADCADMGSGPASTASWPASHAAGNKFASVRVETCGAARAATPGASSSDAGSADDPQSASQQDMDASTAGPCRGRAEHGTVPMRPEQMAGQTSVVSADADDAEKCALLPAAADVAAASRQPAAREQRPAISESSVRHLDAVEVGGATPAEQRSSVAMAPEDVAGVRHSTAFVGDACDMGSSWESDVHAGAGCAQRLRT